MTEEQQRFVELAREYCRLIDGLECLDAEAVENLSGLIARLHAAVEMLGKLPESPDEMMPVDLDRRFELFSRLRLLLGRCDSYRMEYDHEIGGEDLTGSLADDLTDIYCELQHGLTLLKQEPQRAFDCWRVGFRLHWGDHMVDAARHLRQLQLRVVSCDSTPRI